MINLNDFGNIASQHGADKNGDTFLSALHIHKPLLFHINRINREEIRGSFCADRGHDHRDAYRNADHDGHPASLDRAVKAFLMLNAQLSCPVRPGPAIHRGISNNNQFLHPDVLL